MRIIESRRYAPGQAVIREGDESEEAYVIRAGTAEVLKRNSTGREVPIAVLDDGEIFGEMGLLLDRPRSATVRARSELLVDVVDPRAFTTLFDGDVGRRLLPIIQILGERLRMADARLAELESQHGASGTVADEPADPEPLSVQLVAATPEAERALGGERSVDIVRFPCRVGRSVSIDETSLFHVNDLHLKDEKPYTVSPSHFTLIRSHNACYLQDRGSKFGCTVNGRRVGGGYKNLTRAALHSGRNSLRIGGSGSPLRFSLIVQRGDADDAARPPLFGRLKGYLSVFR